MGRIWGVSQNTEYFFGGVPVKSYLYLGFIFGVPIFREMATYGLHVHGGLLERPCITFDYTESSGVREFQGQSFRLSPLIVPDPEGPLQC